MTLKQETHTCDIFLLGVFFCPFAKVFVDFFGDVFVASALRDNILRTV